MLRKGTTLFCILIIIFPVGILSLQIGTNGDSEISDELSLVLTHDEDNFNRVDRSLSLPNWSSTYVPQMWKSSINISVVFVGFSANSTVKNDLSDRITPFYTPTISLPYLQYLANYTLNINYYDAPSAMYTDLFNYMDSISTVDSTPPSHLTDYDPAITSARLIDAKSVESWLYSYADTYTGLEGIYNETYTLFIMDSLYTGTPLLYYYGYYVESVDPDTDDTFREEYMVSWGGRGRFYFIDWSAGPGNYGEGFGFGTPLNSTTLPPIWDINTYEDYVSQLAYYIDRTISYLFLPSYLYAPVYENNYELDFLFVDATSDGAAYTNALDFVDPKILEEVFEESVPYSRWVVGAWKIKLSDWPELKTIYDQSTITMKIRGKTIYILNSTALIPELEKFFWKPDGWVTIPVFAIVTDGPVYVDSYGVMGKALEEGVLEVKDKNQILGLGAWFGQQTGLTALTIHEAGHYLGLRHPHDGFDEYDSNDYDDDGWIYDWLWDHSATPMTYADGIIMDDFGRLNYDSLDRGHVLQLYNTTQWNVYQAACELQDKGYPSYKDAGSLIEFYFEEIVNELNLAHEEFEKMNYEDPYNASAFFHALEAKELSEDLILALSHQLPLLRQMSLTIVDVLASLDNITFTYELWDSSNSSEVRGANIDVSYQGKNYSTSEIANGFYRVVLPYSTSNESITVFATKIGYENLIYSYFAYIDPPAVKGGTITSTTSTTIIPTTTTAPTTTTVPSTPTTRTSIEINSSSSSTSSIISSGIDAPAPGLDLLMLLVTIPLLVIWKRKKL